MEEVKVSKGDRKDIPYLHYLRVFAIYMVVFLHCRESIPVEGIGGIVIGLSYILTLVGVPLFVMISGALIFPKDNGDVLYFYKKRMPKLIIPLLVWGSVYSILHYYMGTETLEQSLIDIIRLPIAPRQPGLMWYLYMMIGIYLIVPFFTYDLFSRNNYKNSVIYLILWSLAVLLGSLKHPLGDIEILNSNFPGRSYDVFQYFAGFFGFFVLGAWLGAKKEIDNKWLVILPILIVIIYFLDKLIGIERGYLTLIAILLSTFFFILFKKLFNKEYKWGGYSLIKKISEYSYGVYLCHMVIYYLITENIYRLSGNIFCKHMLVPLITFIIATLFTALVYKVHYLRKIVGSK